MIRTQDIQPLSKFRQNATAELDRLAENGGAQVLTVNGEAKGVVMAPETYDRIAEKLLEAEIQASIRTSLEEFTAGQGIDAKKGLLHIAQDMNLGAIDNDDI